MLVPCPACARHVRVSEATCPFCATAMPEAPAPVPGTNQRLSRAAAYAFTATVAAAAGGALVACSSSSTAVALYGAPAVIDGGDGSTNDAADDAPDDTGGGQALYGAPAYGAQPVDSGEG
jgi:hypothetical protein